MFYYHFMPVIEWQDLVRILGIMGLTVAAMINDLKHYRISNYLNLVGLIAAILLLFVEFISGGAYMTYIYSGVLSFGFFYLCYLFRAIGAGDTKLLTVIGLLSGMKLGCDLFLHVALISILICAVVLIRNSKQKVPVMAYGVTTQLHVFHFSIVILIAELAVLSQYFVAYFVVKGGVV